MIQMAEVMMAFPQYTLEDLMRAPLNEAKFLVEQVTYKKQVEAYMLHLQALRSMIKM